MIVRGYRFQRMLAYLHSQGSATGANMQSIQGKYAVGSGGWFGVGLGASREKWGWVPESTTDFIFAIIGEELGLIGTLCVTVLYGGLAFAGLRIARRVTVVFCRMLRDRDHRLDRDPGGHQHRRGDRGPADPTGVPLPLAPPGVVMAGDPGRARYAHVVRQAGARRPSGSAARGPGWRLRVLSWLGLSKRRK